MLPVLQFTKKSRKENTLYLLSQRFCMLFVYLFILLGRRGLGQEVQKGVHFLSEKRENKVIHGVFPFH